MIDKKIYDLDYIRELQERYKTDPGLLERVLYAFGLLEALVKAGMKFTFISVSLISGREILRLMAILWKPQRCLKAYRRKHR